MKQKETAPLIPPAASDDASETVLRLPTALFLDEVARLLAEGQTVTLRVQGHSMLPFLISGRDVVELRHLPQVEVGDVVLARTPEKGYVLHRVYAVTPNKLLLMGDGNVRGTESCLPDAVCGTVLRTLRNGRSLSARSRWMRRKATLWRWLLPLRRYLLFFLRRMMRN